jgi:hypothetical protein
MKVISSLFGEPVAIDEVEVYVSADGQYRAAIARRPDGLFCIYTRWIGGWETGKPPAALVYEDCEPAVGIYATLDDARREVRSYLDTHGAETHV